MLSSVLTFVRLPFLLILIWTVARFSLGLAGVPYAPRGNAMFSIVGLTYISSVYFGALSGRVGGFDWKGTALVGAVLGLFSQILIFIATVVSVAGGLDTSYFLHWDALNVPEGTTVSMGQAVGIRVTGIIANTVIGTILALIGRALGGLAPKSAQTA